MGQAFLHGNGGSNPLNFEVVGNADYPESISKNIIPDAYAKSTTYNGITYTVNGDGSITANGTATGTSVCNVWGSNNSQTLPAGTYALSGCPTGGGSSTYMLCSNDTTHKDTGDGVTFTLADDTAISFKIRINSGVTVSNLKFWPQLERGPAKTAFVKYAQKENTIWIKSGIKMPYWTTASGDAMPTWTAPQGNVVFWWKGVAAALVNSATSAGFRVVKYNSVKGNLFLTPVSCYQQVDAGTAKNWKSMNAYIYKSGTWVQFSSEFSATIKVTYPSGSTLTCTDGTTTLTATTTTGSYTFTVPNAGTWTVKAVSGSNTASKSVSITTSGQTASVTLSYIVYLYNAGDTCESVTGGWESAAGEWNDNTVWVGSTYSAQSGAIATKSKINLTGHNTLSITVDTAHDSSLIFGIRSTVLDTTAALYKHNVISDATAYADAASAGTFSLDISGYTGSYYVFVCSGGSYDSGEHWTSGGLISQISVK